MALKTYKVDIPELNRSCISTIIEMPHKGEHVFIPPEECKIKQITIADVKDNPNLLTIAIIVTPCLHTPKSIDEKTGDINA